MILGFEHQVQLSLLIKAIGAGYFLGIVYSIFMFFNASGGKNAIFIFIRDIIFFVFSAFITFIFALKYNSGIIRFYIPCGELMGFLLFHIFPGNLIGKMWRKLFSLINGRTEKLKKFFKEKKAKAKTELKSKLAVRKSELKKRKNSVSEKKKNKTEKPNEETKKKNTRKYRKKFEKNS